MESRTDTRDESFTRKQEIPERPKARQEATREKKNNAGKKYKQTNQLLIVDNNLNHSSLGVRMCS